MQAVILAAGMGTRLKELTIDKPKCMVEVDGVSMIERVLRELDQLSLKRIIIVDGYLHEKLESFINELNISTPVVFIKNTDYKNTNNIVSLGLAEKFLIKEDTILLESDLVFNSKILKKLILSPNNNIAVVDKNENYMDGTVVRLSKESRVLEFIPKNKIQQRAAKNDTLYKTVNIYKISKNYSRLLLFPLLKTFIKIFGKNDYYEQVFRIITEIKEDTMFGLCIKHSDWYEIDTQDDLAIVEKKIRDKSLRV